MSVVYICIYTYTSAYIYTHERGAGASRSVSFCRCCVSFCFSAFSLFVDTGCHRVIGCLVFIGHFPQKSSIINGSFAKNDLQLRAS